MSSASIASHNRVDRSIAKTNRARVRVFAYDLENADAVEETDIDKSTLDSLVSILRGV